MRSKQKFADIFPDGVFQRNEAVGKQPVFRSTCDRLVHRVALRLSLHIALSRKNQNIRHIPSAISRRF